MQGKGAIPARHMHIFQILVMLTCLDDQNADVEILRQSTCDDTAGGASSDRISDPAPYIPNTSKLTHKQYNRTRERNPSYGYLESIRLDRFSRA